MQLFECVIFCEQVGLGSARFLFKKRTHLISNKIIMADPNPHDMMTCPYNKSHQVEQYRMHIHLQKCRKQYPDSKKTTCPIDATHIVNEIEIDYHVQKCSKRILFDKIANASADELRSVVEVLPPPVVQSDENWDDENVESYKPDPAKKGSHILIKAKGLAPAERRQVRMQGQRTFRPKEE